MGAVPGTSSTLAALKIFIDPDPNLDAADHLLYGSGDLGHDGGRRVENGRGGRGGRQAATNVLVPGDHGGDDHDHDDTEPRVNSSLVEILDSHQCRIFPYGQYSMKCYDISSSLPC